ncbi:MAG TPA: Nramp family divalent metal transporter [Caulobacteraceae bacterium]|jgi:manganese transport protein
MHGRLPSQAGVLARLGLPSIATAPFCPGEVEGTVQIPLHAALYKRLLLFLGPGLLVAVGYMDPGNWATDIESGSRLGAALLFVVVGSGAAAILFQILAARLGVATGLDLAQACARRYSRPTRIGLWLLAELAIVATDVAEVLGAALALNLLFHVPLAAGIVITTFDLVLVLGLKGAGFRRVEAIILALVSTISVCVLAEAILTHPSASEILRGLRPSLATVRSPEALYLSLGIVGATLMPHNLFLHSSVVKTRQIEAAGKAMAMRFNALDTTTALVGATVVNAALLILAASAFHAKGMTDVATIQDAHRLLSPMTGVGFAGVLFAVGLLASGQSATFTGTIAGQVILEGFLDVKIPCWQRRVITRGLAIGPALIGVLMLGSGGVGMLLVGSQVVLAAQLPFTLYPLLRITSDRQWMGRFASPLWLSAVAWAGFAALTAADIWLVAKL